MSEARRGSAVALALVCVTVVAGFAVAFLRVSTAANARQMSEVENLRAFYLAEAGLAEAFQGLRVGRSGQVGSAVNPARQGNGLLWVDAIGTSDDQVRLTSTGLVGRGRATLSLIVEPVEVPLGFFSDEDLVVEDVLLVDGFDSDIGEYSGQVLGNSITIDPESDPHFHIDPSEKIFFYFGHFYRYYASDEDTYYYDHEVDYQVLAADDDFADEHDLDEDDFTDGDGDDWETDEEYGGILDYFSSVPLPEWLGAPVQAPSSPWQGWTSDNGENTNSTWGGSLGGFDSLMSTLDSGLSEGGTPSWGAPDTSTSPMITSPTTGDDGLIGSNGTVRFDMGTGETASIFGDVKPGPEGSVEGLSSVSITGDTESRSERIDLPEVVIPVVTMDSPVRHDGILPLSIPPGLSGHARIEVASGAELILRGPATVVVGELVVEPGATLTLDTRNGNVALYVTGGLDLQAGSNASTTSLSADELSVQVGAIPRTGSKAPINLESNSSFHGTIYSPQTDVYVGTNFEVFGAIVAKKLELGPGAKMHFDNSGVEKSPIPRIVSWRIVEIASAARNLGPNPVAALGLNEAELRPLSEAHELAAVQLDIEYIDQVGVTSTYTGPEADFDWDDVDQIVTVQRKARRPQVDENGNWSDGENELDWDDFEFDDDDDDDGFDGGFSLDWEAAAQAMADWLAGLSP